MLEMVPVVLTTETADNADLKWTCQGSLDTANFSCEGSHLVSFSMFGEISM